MMRCCGPGIPCLVRVDSQGKDLSDSFKGDDRLGPHHVPDDTRRLPARNR